MKIIYSKHLLKDKLPLLKRHGFKITKSLIKSIIVKPDHIDRVSDKPRVIASKDYDIKHVIRIVYSVQDGIIKIITCYPAEKGRYY